MYPSPTRLRILLLGALLLPTVAVLADEPNPDQKRIERLVKLHSHDLYAEKDSTRAAAARELGLLGPAAKQAVPALVRLLKAKGPQVRLEAAFALLKIDQGKGKEALDALAELLEDKTAAPYHIFLVVYMKDIRPASKETVAGCIALVHHKNPLAPVVGCIALDNLGPQAKEAADLLDKALQDDSVLVRSRAALGLYRIDSRNAGKAVPVLKEALKDKDHEVRQHAALGLLEVDRQQLPAVCEALASSLKDPNLDVRLRTAEFLLEQDPAQAKSVLPVLADLLENKDKKRRLQVVQLLAGLGEVVAGAEKDLRARFKDEDGPVAAAAVEALMRLKPEMGSELFPLLVEQRDRKKQTGIADLLKLIDMLHKIAVDAGDHEVLKLLTEQLRKVEKRPHSDLFRLDAAVRLAALGPKAKDAVGDLVKAQADTSLVVRSQALYALGQIGHEAKGAASRLEELYKDRSLPADLRQTAGRALKKVAPDTAKQLGVP